MYYINLTEMTSLEMDKISCSMSYPLSNDNNNISIITRQRKRIASDVEDDQSMNCRIFNPSTSKLSNISDSSMLSTNAMIDSDAQKSSAKRDRHMWENEEKAFFFDALKQHGKDFEAITKFVNQKLKKSCVAKNHDQVRNYYYNTLSKLANFIKLDSKYDILPREARELFTLINFDEWRKKTSGRIKNLENFRIKQKFLELLISGQTTIKCAKKRHSKFVARKCRTPACNALKKFVAVQKSEPIIPQELILEFKPRRPIDHCTVLELEQNPLIKIIAAPHEKLANILDLLEKKWSCRGERSKESTLVHSQLTVFPNDGLNLKEITIIPRNKRVFSDVSSLDAALELHQNSCSFNSCNYDLNMLNSKTQNQKSADPSLNIPSNENTFVVDDYFLSVPNAENVTDVNIGCVTGELCGSGFDCNNFGSCSKTYDRNLFYVLKSDVLKNGMTKSDNISLTTAELFLIMDSKLPLIFLYEIRLNGRSDPIDCGSVWDCFVDLMRCNTLESICKLSSASANCRLCSGTMVNSRKQREASPKNFADDVDKCKLQTCQTDNLDTTFKSPTTPIEKNLISRRRITSHFPSPFQPPSPLNIQSHYLVSQKNEDFMAQLDQLHGRSKYSRRSIVETADKFVNNVADACAVETSSTADGNANQQPISQYFNIPTSSESVCSTSIELHNTSNVQLSTTSGAVILPQITNAIAASTSAVALCQQQPNAISTDQATKPPNISSLLAFSNSSFDISLPCFPNVGSSSDSVVLDFSNVFDSCVGITCSAASLMSNPCLETPKKTGTH